MKLLFSHNILSGQMVARIPAGQYKAFIIRSSGTNAASQAVTAAQHGLLTGLWGGEVFANIEFDDLQDVNNLMGGTIEESSVTSGAFAMLAIIPATFGNDRNVFDVAETDNVFLNLNLSGVTSTIVASGTVEVYGIVSEGLMAYLPSMSTQTPTIAASGTYPLTIPLDNTTHVFISSSTNMARIAIDRDGQSIVEGSYAAVLGISNALWGVETALTTFLGVVIAPSGSYSEKLSDNIVVRITAGSGGSATPNVISVGIIPTPAELGRSISTVKAASDRRIAMKLRAGKTRAVAVAKTLKPDLAV